MDFLSFKAAPRDLLIIATYAVMQEIELQEFEPDLVYVDAKKSITHHSRAIPAQVAPAHLTGSSGPPFLADC